jgi:hypothetical protein
MWSSGQVARVRGSMEELLDMLIGYCASSTSREGHPYARHGYGDSATETIAPFFLQKSFLPTDNECASEY